MTRGTHYVGDVLRRTPVYLRDQLPDERTTLVPNDLHLPVAFWWALSQRAHRKTSRSTTSRQPTPGATP